MKRIKILLPVLLLACSGAMHGQQLLLIKKGHISTRFNEGDDILFELKDERQVIHAVIQSIREFYFVTTGSDSIPYTRVSRIVFRNPERRKYGLYTAAGGLGLLTIYGINSFAFDTHSQSMRGMAFVGGLGVTFGLLITMTANKTVKLNGIKRLKYAAYDSPLYR